jgi:hypothetical protein
MANEITLRRVDLQALTSSPECVAWRRISLGTIQHPGLPLRRYLSGGLTLTAEARARIGAKVAELVAVSESDDAPDNRKARLGLVANMLMAYPMAGGSEESGRARAMAYLSAIDDVPPWAVAEAIRRWHRGEGGGRDANYRFAPAPAELRYAAMQLLQPAKQTIAHLNAVLNALTIERAMDPAPVEHAAARPMLRALR